MGEETKYWYLRNFFLFGELDSDDMQILSRMMHHYQPCKNEFIYLSDQSNDNIFFLKEGFVKIGTVSEDGKEIIKDILQPGEIFGQLNQGEEQKGEYAQAVGDEVWICSIAKKDFYEVLQKHQSLGLRLSKVLGDKLVKMERKLKSLVFKDSRSRIIEFLSELGKEHGRPVGDETLFDNFLTHQDIANLTATSRQTVTTVLNELRDENYIYFDRKRFLIRDLDKFSALAT